MKRVSQNTVHRCEYHAPFWSTVGKMMFDGRGLRELFKKFNEQYFGNHLGSSRKLTPRPCNGTLQLYG